MPYVEVLNWSELLEYDQDYDADVPSTGFILIDQNGQLVPFAVGGASYHTVYVFHMENGDWLHDVLIPADVTVLRIPMVALINEEKISAFVRGRHDLIAYAQQERDRASRRRSLKYRTIALILMVAAIILLLAGLVMAHN